MQHPDGTSEPSPQAVPAENRGSAAPGYFEVHDGGIRFIDIDTEPADAASDASVDPVRMFMEQVRREDEAFERLRREIEQHAMNVSYARHVWGTLEWLGTLAGFMAGISSLLKGTDDIAARRSLHGSLFELHVEQLLTRQRLAADPQAPAWLKQQRQSSDRS